MKTQTSLLSQLAVLPDSWRFVPINGNKQPLGRDWQNTHMTVADFVQAEETGSFSKLFYQPKDSTDKKPVPFKWMEAIGILCGEPSGGILCFDHDGHSCDPLIEELSGQSVADALPKTVAFHGGKDGHYQAMYHIPSMYWDAISHKRILTGVKVWNEFKKRNEDEQIDLRWTGGQSVLIGVHPETGQYKWLEGRSPADVEVAECPLWIIEQMLCVVEEAQQSEPTHQTQHKTTQSTLSDREWALSYLEHIANNDLDWYSWRDVLLALHKAGVSEHEARSWSRNSSKHTDKGFDDVWRYIDDKGRCVGLGTLGMLAKRNGWTKPKQADRPIDGLSSAHRSGGVFHESEIDSQPLNPASKAERLKLDIHNYLKEGDFATRLIMRGEICSTYRLSKQDFTELVTQIESSTDLQHKTEFDGAEFFNIDSDAINWLIPRFLPKGEPIQIFADPGAGKTNLATDAVYAVLGGDRFLGEKVEKPGKVLYICSDESRASAVRRMMSRGVDLLNLANLKVWTYLDINNLLTLERTLEDWRPDLVVADSLTSICMNVGIAEKDPEFARYLYKLKNTVGRYNASLVVIHHSNKNPLAKGQHAASGTNRINAAFWGIYALNEPHKDNPESPVRELVMVKGREVEKFKLTLNFQNRWEWAEKGIFVVTDDNSASPEIKKRYQEIYRYLKSRSPVPLEFAELDAHFNMGKHLYKVLDSLEQDKMISKRRSTQDARRMVYFVPQFEDVTVEANNDQGTPPPCNSLEKRRTPESLTQHKENYSPIYSPTSEENKFAATRSPQTNVTDWDDSLIFGTVELIQRVIDSQNTELLGDLKSRLATIPQWAARILWGRLTSREETLIRMQLGEEISSPANNGEEIGEENSSSPARVSGVLLQKEESLGGGVPPTPREEIECGFKVGDRIDFNGQSRQVESIRKHGDRVRLHLGLNQWVYADEAQPELVEYDEESIEDAAQYLRDAAASNDPAFVQDLLSWEMFTSLTPDSKQRIWGRLTEAERTKINELNATLGSR